MTAWLCGEGYPVNQKRIRRLLRLMGLEAIYQRPKLSDPAPGHRIYPYLLRGLAIERPNQVWSTEEVYLHDYQHVPEAILGLQRYFNFYNHQRLHQALDYQTPGAVFRQSTI